MPDEANSHYFALIDRSTLKMSEKEGKSEIDLDKSPMKPQKHGSSN